MQVNFKSPVSIDGVHFRPGIQQVPDLFAKHWYLLALIQNGTALIVEDAKAEPEVGDQEPQDAPSYREHMAKWESKADKKAEGKVVPKAKRVRSRAKAKPEVQPEGM